LRGDLRYDDSNLGQLSKNKFENKISSDPVSSKRAMAHNAYQMVGLGCLPLLALTG
jgi:hypothetical protein